MENPPGCTWGPYTAGWFNEECYSFPTLWLFFVGCALWAAAYLVIIRNGIRYKFVEMPAIAGAADIAWEFTYSFVHETNMGKMAEYTYHVWFLTDVALAWLLFQHGHKQGWSPFMVRHFKPMLVIATLVWFLFFVTYQPSGYTDHYIGAITAYADNVVISVCYIFLLASVKDVRAVSPWVAWLKFLGTFLNTIFMILTFHDYFLWTMGLVIAVIDVGYIVWLYRRRAAQARGIPGVPAFDSLEPVAVQTVM